MAEIVSVQGLNELHKVLQNLPVDIEKKYTRNALAAGGRVLRDEARGRVPVESGDLRKSIRVSTRQPRKGKYRIRANVIAGNKAAYYAHWIEYGTASYYTGTGKSVGKPYEIKAKTAGALFFGGHAHGKVMHPGIHPQPFMRPTFDAATDQAIQKMADNLRARLEKEKYL